MDKNENEFEGSPKTWPPLGMPIGSVRALLTLIVLAVVLVHLLREDRTHELDALWIQTLLIALAHYFTARRYVPLPPDVMIRLEDEGLLERERHPLFLPRNSIRTIIIAAFAAFGAYLYHENRLFKDHQATALLGLVCAYFLGAVVGGIGKWFSRRSAVPPSGSWGDLKAMVVLLVVTMAAIPELINQPMNIDPIFHRIALWLMLFYYGSR